jgi:hypothetical protein
MQRTVLRVLPAAVLSAALAAPIATSADAAGTVPAAQSAAAQMTSLTLRVHGCNGCVIQPVRAGDGSHAALWRGKKKAVRKGSVHWNVSQGHTVGMSFDIDDPKQVDLDFMTNIVIAYRGIKVGARVPPGVARHKSHANGCWAGTDRAAVTLRVRVERFPSLSDFPPVMHGYRIRPYVVRTRPFLRLFDGPDGTYSRGSRGTIGNQDAYFCSGSPVRR